MTARTLMTTTRPHTNRDDVSDLDRLRRLYESIHDSTTNGALGGEEGPFVEANDD